MRKSKCLFVVIAALFVVSAAQAVHRKVSIKPSASSLSLRQTQKVATVTNVANTLSSASVLAENLDIKAGKIIEAMSLGSFKKWMLHIDEQTLRTQYADEMLLHMNYMTALFRLHRQKGHFEKYNEFEFQNLLVKSDYLLSLLISRESLQSAQHSEVFAKKLDSALHAYNRERIDLDKKMIHFAFNQTSEFL